MGLKYKLTEYVQGLKGNLTSLYIDEVAVDKAHKRGEKKEQIDSVGYTKGISKECTPECWDQRGTTKRVDIPLKFLEYIVQGQLTSSLSGNAESAKLDLLTALIEHIPPECLLRVNSATYVNSVREVYPYRNVVYMEETQIFSPTEVQDIRKKIGLWGNILVEETQDNLAVNIVNAYKMQPYVTLFLHHATTTQDMVIYLRNAVVKEGGYTDIQTAERLVTDVVKLDVHLGCTSNGEKYIERITEIIPLEELENREKDCERSMHSLEGVYKDYYMQKAVKLTFITKDILRYDLDTQTYYAVERLSQLLEQKLRMNLDDLTRQEYDMYVQKTWGSLTSAEVKKCDALEEGRREEKV